MYETTITVVGRLATAASGMTFDNGGTKATFRLASTERRFDRALQEWVDGSSLFLTVVCWRRLAERVLATLGVGDAVIVTGRLRARSWEKDGHTHSALEIEASSVGPDLARCSAVVVRRSSTSATTDPAATRPTADPATSVLPGASVRTSEEPVPVGVDAVNAVSGADGPDGGDVDDDVDAPVVPWNGGPLVPEYLGPVDQTFTEERWPAEAGVRA